MGEGLTNTIAVVLLAGGLTPSPLASAARMPALRLAPDGSRTVLRNWLDRLDALAGAEGVERLHLRIVFDTPRDADYAPIAHGRVAAEFQCESGKYRGPAGVARDMALGLPCAGDVLIAEANRWPLEDLSPLVHAHRDAGAEITVARQRDCSPAGMYVTTRAALELVPQRGFMDLKEQWLARAIAGGMHVRVFTFAGDGAPALRTRDDVLDLTQKLTSPAPGMKPAGSAPLVLDGAPPRVADAWRVISPDAAVDATAIVIESVVMPGARVEAGAILARSVATPGSVVRAGARLVGAIAPGDAAIGATLDAITREEAR